MTAAFAAWRAECEHARDLANAAASPDVTGMRGGTRFSLRWVMVHMIEEYGRHNGHADLLRGRVGRLNRSLTARPARATGAM